MNRETFTDGNKTLISTDYYLKLLKFEQIIKKIEKMIEIGANTYVNGGSRTALFEVLCEIKEIIEDGDNGKIHIRTS